MKKVINSILIFLLILTTIFSISSSAFAASVPTIKYCAHVQNVGWQSWVTNGATAGTTGKSLRLEAIKIALKKGNTSMISYRAHVSDYGWRDWKSSGGIAGITGKSKPIEAVQIKLNGDYAKKYDIYYRLHLSYIGWLGWAKNGAVAGSTGMRLRSEAIQIKLVKKGASFNTGGKCSLSKPSLTCQAYIQKSGWLKKVGEGSVVGTTGKNLALRMINLKFNNFYGKAAIQYRTHVSGVGWKSWVNSGTSSGVSSKNIEAVQIRLTNTMDTFFNVYYRMHVKNYGWLGWAKNGEVAGTTGGGLQAEAIQVKIVPTATAFAVGGAAYLNLSGSSITDSQLNMLKKLYPEGTPWDSSVYMHLGSGCYAFSHECFWRVNGREATCCAVMNIKFDNIKAGDCIGKNPGKEDGTQHWIYVIKKTSSQITVGEGNYYDEDKQQYIVHWGRVISKAEFERDFASNRVDR